MLSSVPFVRLVGALGLLVMLIAVYAALTARFSGTIRRPVMAMELARSAEEVHQVLDPPGNVETMRRQLFLDGFYIASYWLFFVGIAGLLAGQAAPGSAWIGAVTGVAATAAALFDLRENQGICGTLSAFPSRLSLAGIRDTREASVLKWLLFYFLLLLVARLFLDRPDATHWLGIGLAAAGLLGVAGLLAPSGEILLQGAFLLSVIGQLIVTIIWLGFPSFFLRNG